MTDMEYRTLVEEGEVVGKSGQHDSSTGCDCEFEEPIDKYRDKIVEYNGRKYIIYHTTPVLVDDTLWSTIILDSGGWKTKSTKERINRHLPDGFKLYQEDNEWYLERKGDREDVEFHDGMKISTI